MSRSVPFVRCSVCQDDFPKWNMVATCARQHSHCKDCASSMILEGKHASCPLCRDPLFTAEYYPKKAFDHPFPLPNVSLQESLSIDLSEDYISPVAAVLRIARRESRDGVLLSAQLYTESVLAELRATTGRFRGQKHYKSLNNCVYILKLHGFIQKCPKHPGRYIVHPHPPKNPPKKKMGYQ